MPVDAPKHEDMTKLLSERRDLLWRHRFEQLLKIGLDPFSTTKENQRNYANLANYDEIMQLCLKEIMMKDLNQS